MKIIIGEVYIRKGFRYKVVDYLEGLSWVYYVNMDTDTKGHCLDIDFQKEFQKYEDDRNDTNCDRPSLNNGKYII